MKTIRTNRLTLRPWQLSDADDLFSYARDEETGRLGGWKPHESREESLDIIIGFIKNNRVWAVCDNKSGKCIGSLGLRNDVRRNYKEARELGFDLSKEYRNKGLMTEAVQAVLDYAFNETDIQVVSVTHFPHNKPSMRVIEKCGFICEGTLKNAYRLYNGETCDCICYSMSAADYHAVKNGVKEVSVSDSMKALLSENDDLITNLSNAAALLFNGLCDISWAGFYIKKNDVLLLGPFQGKPACTRIPLGRGVCGKAAAENKTLVVDDVHLFEGHIACDSASESEMVVPIMHEGRLAAVLDVDSTVKSRFSRKDACELIKAAEIIESVWK